jgi:ketosteroid isomerase-like protein
MSALETVQSFYAGAAAGDMDKVRSVLGPELQWVQSPGFPNASVYHAPDDVMTGVFGRLGAEWDGFAAVPEDYIDAGDRVVVLGTYSGTSKETGRSFEAPFAHVWTVRDGAIVAMRQFTDTKIVRDAWRDERPKRVGPD